MSEPKFEGTVSEVPQWLRSEMRGVSWHAELPGGFSPPGFDELRLLSLSHWTFDDSVASGRLIVASEVADPLLDIFRTLFRLRFPIAKMRLVDDYGGDDELSMTDNNTSAFNCRLIAGTQRPSKHALGVAVDINPIQNPYIAHGKAHPPAGHDYLDRTRRRTGMLLPDDAVVSAFKERGWIWGGDWIELKDYHHFELPDEALSSS